MLRMIKKILLTCLLLLPIIGGLSSTVNAQSESDNVELILHKRILRDIVKDGFEIYENDGAEIENDATGEKPDVVSKTTPLNGAKFSIYDLTDYYENGGWVGEDSDESPETFVKKISGFSRNEMRALIKKENFSEVENSPVVTANNTEFGDGVARITVPRMNDGRMAVYLIFEEEIDDKVEFNVDMEELSVPLVVILPFIDPANPMEELDQIHLYPKNIGYLRDPYFFKYGKENEKIGGTGNPLEGAEFVLYRIEGGEKLYLDLGPANDLQNTWLPSSDPLKDDRISKFKSGKDGLVTTGGRLLASGTYYFEEVKSPQGYKISKANQAIKVVVPEHWEKGKEKLYVTVNGQEMLESPDGSVPEKAREKIEPRVYNYRHDETIDTRPPTTQAQTPTKSAGSKQASGSSGRKKYLPVTGEAKSLISLIGLLLLGTAVLIWYRRKVAVKVKSKDEQ